MRAAIRPIPGWPGYGVDAEGVVYSYWARVGVQGGGSRAVLTTTPRTLRTFDRGLVSGAPSGYRSVSLRRDGRSRNMYVHDLVMRAWVGPRPSPEHEICHGNRDRSDNRLANLRYDTIDGNTADRRRDGAFPRGPDAYVYRRDDMQARRAELVGAFDDLLEVGT